MPEGYERLRDALKRKGKSDEEAKSMAAAIWNKHHKDNPVTNKKHEMEAKLEILHEFGLAKKEQLMNYGDQLMAKVGGAARKDSGGRVMKIKPKPGSPGISGAGLWPSGKPAFMFEEQKFGVILLGLPTSDFFQRAEQLLTDRLGRKLAKNALAPSSQIKKALPGPLAKYPSLPNPNPNAAAAEAATAPASKFGEWTDTAATTPKPGDGLESILAYLKKRNRKQVPIARSQGGRGWFPERGDIRDY